MLMPCGLGEKTISCLITGILYQIRLGKYIIVKARQEAGGRRQEEDHYSIKTGFSIIDHNRE